MTNMANTPLFLGKKEIMFMFMFMFIQMACVLTGGV